MSAPTPRSGNSGRYGRSGSSPNTIARASSTSWPGIEPTPVAAPLGHGAEGDSGLTSVTVWESPAMGDQPPVVFRTAADWAAWLDARHATEPGIWLQLAKKGSGEVSVTYDEALRVALCYGWIDGLKRPLDDTWWLQRFTPRRPRSRWSQRNCRIVEELIAEGRMMPSGRAEVDRARADGRWD